MKAICIKCGEAKNGAWQSCPACQFTPVDDNDKAQHLFLSSHFNNENKLKKFSEHIKKGNDIDFKAQDLALVTAVLERKEKNKKAQQIYILKLWGVFALTIAVMIGFYYIKK